MDHATSTEIQEVSGLTRKQVLEALDCLIKKGAVYHLGEEHFQIVK